MSHRIVEAMGQLRAFTARQWFAAAAIAFATGVFTGLPTDIVPNPVFRRMTPILWWNYPVWVASAVLAGLVAATYVRRLPAGSAGVAASGGVLSFFAVGCPICNKLVVGVLGVSGALSFFAPVQPYLAGIGLALLTVSLLVRLGQSSRCVAPDRPPTMAVPAEQR